MRNFLYQIRTDTYRKDQAAHRSEEMNRGGLSYVEPDKQRQRNKTEKSHLISMESPGNDSAIVIYFHREIKIIKGKLRFIFESVED